MIFERQKQNINICCISHIYKSKFMTKVAPKIGIWDIEVQRSYMWDGIILICGRIL